MFIHKSYKKNIILNNQLDIKNSNFSDYNVEKFFNNLITPSIFNDIIGIYIIFNKKLNKEEDILVKEIIEKYIDYGFTNILHLSYDSCILVRFDIQYEKLCNEIQNMYTELEKHNINIKCSIIYGDHRKYFVDLYKDMESYLSENKSENVVFISNYYEYMFKKNNP